MEETGLDKTLPKTTRLDINKKTQSPHSIDLTHLGVFLPQQRTYGEKRPVGTGE